MHPDTWTYHLCIYYIVWCMSVYRHMRKNNKPVRSENLKPQEKGFIWLVWGNSFTNNVYTLYTLYRIQIHRCTPIKGKKGCPPDPLHPSLDTGMGKTYIIILFLSNLHIMHSNVPALILNQNCNIVPNLHTYNFPNNLSLYLTCFMFLFFTNVPNSCMHIAQCTYGHLHCLFLT